MQKWEYKTTNWWRGRKGGFSTGATDWQSNTNFDELGNQGWELVAAFSNSDTPGEYDAGFTTGVVFVFKRPKE